jgi:hypothetical protein
MQIITQGREEGDWTETVKSWAMISEYIYSAMT